MEVSKIVLMEDSINIDELFSFLHASSLEGFISLTTRSFLHVRVVQLFMPPQGAQ